MPRFSGRITIACVGKLRATHWRIAQDEYAERLRRYVQLDIAEVKDQVGRSLPDAVAIQREGDLLLAAVAGTRRKIALTPTGRLMDSSAFAAYLRRQIDTYGHLAFVIGGPVGLSTEILGCCDDALSLSQLTFPHELARVILLEQVYRAMTILHGEGYHK